MKTIEIYENMETQQLKSLMKIYETRSKLLEKFPSKNKENMKNDIEIDYHLIKMELNKRLWAEN